MWVSPVWKLFAATAALALCVAGAAQAQNSPDAQRVLDRARAASGGASGWNKLRGLHEKGVIGGVKFERWIDPVRYGIRTETQTQAGKHVAAYNGAGEWRILPNGVKTGSVEPAVMAEVRSDAFFGAHGYFYPSRFDLRSSHLGTRQSGGRSFDVLRVQPAGGEPRELWFDRKTGLLGQVVDATGPKQGRTELFDYRKAGPVQVPFRTVTHDGGRTAPEERKLESLEFPTANRDLFSLPPPPEKAAPSPPPPAPKGKRR
jgi:hypothetical protein